MRVLGLALAGVITVSTVTSANANGPGSNTGWGGRPGVGGGHIASGQVRQWHGGRVSPHWRQGPHPQGWIPFGGPGVPTYWVWGPSGGAFDYPFADWRGPTGGWGNP